ALGIVALAKLPAFMNAHLGTEQARIVLAGPPALTAPAAALLHGDYSIVAIRPPTAAPSSADLARLHAGRLVSLSSDGKALHVVVYSTDPPSVDTKKLALLLLPLDLRVAGHFDAQTAARLSAFSVDVRSARNAESIDQAEVARSIAFTLIFFLYLLVMLNSQLTMAGVIEEKTNRIAELLVASVDPLALLYGKILAGATLGLVQMIVWIGSAILAGASSASGSGGQPFDLGGALHGALTPSVVVAFLFFLLVGLLQFSTLFAGIGSLISRPEDLGSINAAMVLPIAAALLVAFAALDAPNAALVVTTSFIPLLAPFTMFARIAVGQAPMWQIAASAAVNLAALIAIAFVAGRLYRVGMLLYGRPPSLRQVWTTIRARS
ncbi:MAG TPA: ABC transporter permease, partial [Candidatus Baltobacteraceae bacterium]|nr:ABC transporter permease [Candidatus Baltobacteraceae bacterium]